MTRNVDDILFGATIGGLILFTFAALFLYENINMLCG